MLRFELSRAATTLGPDAWDWTGTSWQAPGGRITPFLHPSLLHRLLTDGTALAVVSHERQPQDPPTAARAPLHVTTDVLHETLRAMADFPLDSLTLLMKPGLVTVRAGCWGVAPVHLAAAADSLAGSWDLADLRDRARVPCDREITRLLTRRHRYGHETPWEGIRRLTERSHAQWSDGGLTLHYPAAAEHTRARRLRSGADVLDAFESVLDRAVGRRRHDPARTAVELSGGLDSANVAAALARRTAGRVTASALLFGGAMAAGQRRHRRMMIEEFGFPQDLTVPVDGYLPFTPGGLDDFAPSPYSEPWLEAKQPMMSAMRSAGVEVSFGGTGGDELCSLRAAESPPQARWQPQPPWYGGRLLACADQSENGTAPASVIHESILLAFASRAPQFLRNGLWPVSPLADPELIRFCEWLPRPWREHKTVQRLRLARLGLPLEVFSSPRDDPREILDGAVRRNVLPYLTDLLDNGGLLLDGGYLDPDGLRTTMDLASHARGSRRIDRSLFLIASVERGLRACSAVPDREVPVRS